MGSAMDYVTGTGNLKAFVNVVGNNKFDSACLSIRSKFYTVLLPSNGILRAKAT